MHTQDKDNDTPVQVQEERTTPLASTGTLFWRIFVPVFSTVMLTVALVTIWVTPEAELYLSYPALWLRIAISLIWLTWVTFMYRTLWRLRRIDANSTHVYVTDYWRTARYLWADVDRFTESRHLGRRIVHLHLKGSGIFGQKISFLPASHFDQWISENKH